ncbi:MAG: hypothetical protein U0469_01735 [Candidatus Paceibacterota bacterium]
MKIKFNKIKALATGALLLSVLSIAVVNAETNKRIEGKNDEKGRPEMMIKNGKFVSGTVTAINGNTLTLSATNPNSSSTTIYTVDISNAFIVKNGATGIAVNDKVVVSGIVNGNSIIAKIVYDGPNFLRAEKEKEPIDGIVTAINGNILTISQNIKREENGSSTKIYTVDATNALIIKGGATSSVSAINVNDKIMVNGTVNGTTITAKIIHDGVGQKNWNKDGEKHDDKENFSKTEKEQTRFFDKFKNFFRGFLRKNR